MPDSVPDSKSDSVSDLIPGSGPASVRVEVPGKINLLLRVGERRDDGFHPLNTVYFAVGPGSTVEATVAPRTSTTFGNSAAALPDISSSQEGGDRCELEYTAASSVDPSALPMGGDNLVVQAVDLLGRRLREAEPQIRLPRLRFTVTKNLPVAAGLAGGSAEAAGALRAAARLWAVSGEAGPANLEEQLERLAAQVASEVGSDVPFLLRGGISYGYDRGQQLVSLAGAETYWVLITLPQKVSTADVYAEFDRLSALGLRSDCYSGKQEMPLSLAPPPELEAALASGASQLGEVLRSWGENAGNDLTSASVRIEPKVGEVLALARREKLALAALVCGSGPSVAVLAADRIQATMLGASLRRQLRRDFHAECRVVSGPRTTVFAGTELAG